MSSTQNLAMQVGQALNGISFSLATPLHVPWLNGVPENMPARSLVDVPTGFDNFARTSGSGDTYKVLTRWGEGDVSTVGAADKARTDFVTRPILGTLGDSVEFVMRSGLNGDRKRYVGAVLSYHAVFPFFAAIQLGHIRGTNDPDRIIMTRAGGIGAIAVLSGIEFLRDVAFSRASSGDASWKEVLESVDGGISPMTAFLVAQILSEELYPEGFANRWELFVDGTNSGPLAMGQNGRMFADSKIERARKDGHVGVQTIARNVGIEPGEYMRGFLPTATVSYLPAGAYSDVIRGPVPEPAIEVVQNVAFSPRGQTPYAEAVADLVIEVAGLRPTLFPLVR